MISHFFILLPFRPGHVAELLPFLVFYYPSPAHANQPHTHQMAATAAGVLLSSLTHKSVSTSHHLADMPSSNVNIVHLHRPMQQQQQQPVSKLLVKPGLKVRACTRHTTADTQPASHACVSNCVPLLPPGCDRRAAPRGSHRVPLVSCDMPHPTAANPRRPQPSSSVHQQHTAAGARAGQAADHNGAELPQVACRQRGHSHAVYLCWARDVVRREQVRSSVFGGVPASRCRLQRERPTERQPVFRRKETNTQARTRSQQRVENTVMHTTTWASPSHTPLQLRNIAHLTVLLTRLQCCADKQHRHVKRSYNLFTGDVSIAAVDDAHACQTGQGDMLFLKGNAFPGLYGE